MRRKFKVRAGVHYEQNAAWEQDKTKDREVRYKEGDIFESSEDLCAKFVNKFEEIKEAPPAAPVDGARRKSVDDLIATGCWSPDDRDLLEHMPEQQFQKLASLTPASRQDAMKTEKAREEQKQERKRQSSPLGQDVTEDFPKALDLGVLVFRNPAGKHQVVKSNAPTKTINPQPLTADKVDEFLEAFSKEK